MKKKLIFVLMLLCLSFTATACENTDQAETAKEGDTTESMHSEESRELELDQDSEGALGPN